MGFAGNTDQEKQEEQIRTMQKGIKKAFETIKEEFTDHLQAINQNTSEVQAIYNVLAELDAKIEKLGERIDELHMYVNPESIEQKYDIELTHREQEVFVVLYAEPDRITAKEIGRKLGFTDEMVNRYVYNIISKGIPVLKQYQGGDMYLSLDLKFKDLQARKNVLKIDEKISKQLLDDRAL